MENRGDKEGDARSVLMYFYTGQQGWGGKNTHPGAYFMYIYPNRGPADGSRWSFQVCLERFNSSQGQTDLICSDVFCCAIYNEALCPFLTADVSACLLFVIFNVLKRSDIN
jgi:hypothetical protein